MHSHISRRPYYAKMYQVSHSFLSLTIASRHELASCKQRHLAKSCLAPVVFPLYFYFKTKLSSTMSVHQALRGLVRAILRAPAHKHVPPIPTNWTAAFRVAFPSIASRRSLNQFAFRVREWRGVQMTSPHTELTAYLCTNKVSETEYKKQKPASCFLTDL